MLHGSSGLSWCWVGFTTALLGVSLGIVVGDNGSVRMVKPEQTREMLGMVVCSGFAVALGSGWLPSSFGFVVLDGAVGVALLRSFVGMVDYWS